MDNSSVNTAGDYPNQPVDKPYVVKFEEVSAAAFKIKNKIYHTACEKSHLSEELCTDIWLKKEYNQITGSFKERSARYMLMSLSDEYKRKGIFAATCGNFGEALSYCGHQLHILVTVVMPLTVPLIHIQKCRKYNASVIVQGNDLSEAKLIAKKLAKDSQTVYLTPDDHNAIAANGSVGLEIYEQVSDIDAVIVPVGSGSLIAGVATAIKGLNSTVKIIGVQAERSMSFSISREKGQIVSTKPEISIAKSLITHKVGRNSFMTANPLIDRMVTVNEQSIAIAMLRLFELDKCVVEGAGATPIAALLSGQLEDLLSKRVVCILSGCNMDIVIFSRCLQFGLIADNRIIPVIISIPDRPGSAAELFRQLATIGVSVRNTVQTRNIYSQDVYSSEFELMCEVRDESHAIDLYKLMKERYSNARFPTAGPFLDNLEQSWNHSVFASNSPLSYLNTSINSDARNAQDSYTDQNYQNCLPGCSPTTTHLGDTKR